MAKTTNLTLRHKMLYHVFIRNFTEEGTFLAIIPKLPRLKALGTDIIMLHSIFEATEFAQEGKAGNPYVVKNYEEIGAEYGTFEDFTALVKAIHDLGMQVVLNFPIFHLSRDSDLIERHPEFFLKNELGEMISRIQAYDTAWDLDYSNPKLWDYLIKYLEHWAKYVDGFAANGAPLVRPEFWSSARDEVEDVHPFFYWIGGSLSDEWLRDLQIKNIPYLTEGELYATFDVLDERSMSELHHKFYNNDIDVSNYTYLLNWYELRLPRTYVKMRGFEIDDTMRIAAQIQDTDELEAWTAFSFFQKGIAAIMMGQEYGITEKIDIRSKEVINWTKQHDMSDLISRLAQMKKREICKSGYYIIQPEEPNVIVASYHYYNQHLFGFFKLRKDNNKYQVTTGLPTGKYKNLLDDEIYTVSKGYVTLKNKPVVLAYEGDLAVPK